MRYSVGGVRKVVPAACAPLRQRRHGRKPHGKCRPADPVHRSPLQWKKGASVLLRLFFNISFYSSLPRWGRCRRTATDEGLHTVGIASCDILLCTIPHQSPTLWMFSHRENAARRFASRTALPQGKPKVHPRLVHLTLFTKEARTRLSLLY